MRHAIHAVTLTAIVTFLLVACGGDQKKPPANPNTIKSAQKKQVIQPNEARSDIPDKSGDGAKVADANDSRRTPAAPVAPVPSTPADSEPAAKVDGPPPVGIVRTATSMVRRGQYNQAIAQTRAALRRSEKYVPAMVVMARAYYHLGKLEFATSVCDIALKLRPATGACYNLMGHIALKKDNRPLALKNFEKATQVDPGFGPGWLNYGAMLVEVKNFAKAVPALEKATQLLPGRAEALLNLGAAYRGDGQLLKARHTLDRAFKVRANYPDALFNMAILYLDAQKAFDGKTRLQQLTTAELLLNRYKQTRDYDRSGPVDEYVKQAQKLRKREERRLKREQRRKAREAAKAAKKTEKKPAPTK